MSERGDSIASFDRAVATPQELALVLAVALVLTAAFTPPEISFPAACAGLALGFHASRNSNRGLHSDGRLLIVGSVFGVSLLGLADGIVRLPDTGGIGLALRLCIAFPGLWWLVARAGRTRRGLGTAVTLTVVVATASSVQLLAVEGGSSLGVDVYLIHQAAAFTLKSGGNPYSDAAAPNTSPFAEEGDIIVGYPYPPVALHTYSTSDALFDDTRWASLAAWIGSLSLIAWLAWRRASPAAVACLVLLAAAPTWPYTLFAGWTEPLTLLLLAVSLQVWQRPIASAVALGLALASKQYMVVLVPVLLFLPDPLRFRRTLTAGSVAALTLIPWYLADPSAFRAALIETPLSIGFRPDSQSLPGFLDAVGLPFELPRLVWAPLVVAAGVLFARRSVPGSRGPALAVALTLGVTFVTGLAFPNYWLLVAGIVVIASTRTVDDEVRVKPHSPLPGTN